MLEHDQVNGQGTQAWADRDRRIRHPRWARRHMLPPLPALGPVQVMLDPLRRQRRDLHLLQRPRRAQTKGGFQVRAASARARRVMVDHLVWPGTSPSPTIPAACRACACLAARRGGRDGLRPGRTSSEDGGIDELPLSRDIIRSSRTTRSRSLAISACCVVSAEVESSFRRHPLREPRSGAAGRHHP